MTILHVYYTVSAMYMYMYKCCILMGFIAYWNFQINHLNKKKILKYIVNVEANIVDLDQAASVRAARSGSPMFNQMVRVYTM